MDFQTAMVKQITVLRLQGRFDSYEGTALSDWLREHAQLARLVINMELVSFLDSRALSQLVHAMKQCRSNGGDVHLCGLQKPVSVIFEFARFDMFFRIFEDENAAVQAFGST